MVCLIEETVVESAGVDLRSGVDGALLDDGGGGMAGVATGWLGQTAQAAAHFPHATGAQRALDAAVLRSALDRVAFAEIVLLWLAIAWTITAFWRVHRAAAWLLVPYLAWVGFAAVLNGTLWRLNP